jgi:cation diffusion facilitator family transporter
VAERRGRETGRGSDSSANFYGKTQEQSSSQAHREKINAAITSIIASAALTISKIAIALITNSLGILSEGMHSGLDLVAATMTLYAVRMARKPPDLEHSYGYAKFESLTSLAEIILLLAIAAWIMYEGIERLFFVHSKPEITIFSFGVMISSIIVDYGRSRALYKAANKHGSQALEADALHFRVDMLTSAIVLAGLVIVYLFGIQNADAIAALTVSVLIIYTSLGLGRRTLDVLLDKAPKGIQAQILEAITGFEGVKKAHKIRVRKVGNDTFVDLHIELPRTFTHDRAHRIATNVENKIRDDVLPDSDIVVHVDAIEDSDTETVKDKVRLVASEFPQIENIHSIYLSKMAMSYNVDSHKSNINNNTDNNNVSNEQPENINSDQSLHLYLDIQMDSSLPLEAAHTIIDEFEKSVKSEIPSIRQLTTHIESTESNRNLSVGSEETVDKSFLEKIKEIALSINGVTDCKDIALVNVGTDLHITLTIEIIADEGNNNNMLSVSQAHEIATAVQNKIIESIGATRVIIHTEPG